jgi:hypothetical protein
LVRARSSAATASRTLASYLARRSCGSSSSSSGSMEQRLSYLQPELLGANAPPNAQCPASDDGWFRWTYLLHSSCLPIRPVYEAPLCAALPSLYSVHSPVPSAWGVCPAAYLVCTAPQHAAAVNHEVSMSQTVNQVSSCDSPVPSARGVCQALQRPAAYPQYKAQQLPVQVPGGSSNAPVVSAAASDTRKGQNSSKREHCISL